MAKATSLFQTVNPDGSVTFDFNGHISAQGVDLKGGQQPGNQIRWLRNSDGSVLASLNAFDSNDGVSAVKKSQVTLSATADTIASGGTATVTQSAQTGAGAGTLKKTLELSSSGIKATQTIGASGATQINIWSGGTLPGNSDFAFQANALALLAASGVTNKAIAFGSSVATFAGGSAVADKVIAHGLGVVPVFVVAIAVQLFEIACFSEILSGPTSTNFTARMETRDGSLPAAGVNKNFYWAAIG